MVDHEELPCSNTRLWAEEAQAAASQLLVTFKGSSESGKEKSHLLQNTGKLPPLVPCCSHPGAFQEPAEFPTDPALPAEAERPEKDSRNPMTAPSVPAPAALHAPLCRRHCAGV